MGVTSRHKTIRSLLENESTFGTLMLVALLDEFGTEMFEWEPETIRMEITDTYGCQLPSINEHKIWSLITSQTTNQFFRSVEIFRATCSALCNDEPDFGVWSPNTPEELAWGVTEVLLSSPVESAEDEFSNEIERYTGLVLKMNGILEPPSILKFAEYGAANPVLDLDTAFVDDPAMFEAAWGAQQKSKLEIDEFVEAHTQELLYKIGQLPLQHAESTFMTQLRQLKTG